MIHENIFIGRLIILEDDDIPYYSLSFSFSEGGDHESIHTSFPIIRFLLRKILSYGGIYLFKITLYFFRILNKIEDKIKNNERIKN